MRCIFNQTTAGVVSRLLDESFICFIFSPFFLLFFLFFLLLFFSHSVGRSSIRKAKIRQFGVGSMKRPVMSLSGSNTSIDQPVSVENELPFLRTSLMRSQSTGYGLGNSRIFCWGNNGDGQLGLGDVRRQAIVSPTKLGSVDCDNISDIGCGLQHSVFVMDNGSIYACGNNDYGQLAMDTQRSRPACVTSLESYNITKVACGAQHNLALSDGGQVLVWGRNDLGQLGLGKVPSTGADGQLPTIVSRPRLLKSIALECVIQVACGYHHSLALTDTGKLYAWGDNKYGQLGIGKEAVGKFENSPVELKCMDGVPIRQIMAGGYHSAVLTVSGALFTWGRNDCGQLGLEKLQDEPYPRLVRSLRSQRVRHMACGKSHSAVLTASGTVFSFGEGCHGQLGHTSFVSDSVPKTILELMGSEVIQILCGRAHTTVLVKNSDTVYSFGQNGLGQLGCGISPEELGRSSQPTAVCATWRPSSTTSTGSTGDKSLPFVLRLFSGSEHNFACVLDASKFGRGSFTNSFHPTPTDMRFPSATELPRILSLVPDAVLPEADEPLVGQTDVALPNDPASGGPAVGLVFNAAEGRISAEYLERLEKVFTSKACLNASFLVDELEPCSSRNHGIDVQAALDGFKTLAYASDQTAELMERCLGNQLIPKLPRNPPDVEAMRVFLMLPFCHLFGRPMETNAVKIVGEYCYRAFELENAASKVFNSWLCLLTAELFDCIIQELKRVLVNVLAAGKSRASAATSPLQLDSVQRERIVRFVMEMLARLNRVSETHQIVAYHHFYIAELPEQVDMNTDYLTWLRFRGSNCFGGLGPTTFCSYPFVLDAPTKSVILKIDAHIQKEIAINEAATRTVFIGRQELPVLILPVTRENLVQQTLYQLSKQYPNDFKKPLRVHFLGEDAVDEGGVQKEFFLLIMKEVLDPKYGMFRYYSDSRLIWFSDQTFEEGDMFELIGKLCGLAIYNDTIIDLPFPLALYKKLLKRPVSVEDLSQLDPAIGHSLKQLQDYSGDDLEETFGLNFSDV